MCLVVSHANSSGDSLMLRFNRAFDARKGCWCTRLHLSQDLDFQKKHFKFWSMIPSSNWYMSWHVHQIRIGFSRQPCRPYLCWSALAWAGQSRSSSFAVQLCMVEGRVGNWFSVNSCHLQGVAEVLTSTDSTVEIIRSILESPVLSSSLQNC